MKLLIRIISLAAIYVAVSTGVPLASSVQAAPAAPASSGSSCTNGVCPDLAANPNVNCAQSGCDFIQKYINPGINLLSVLFGLIAVASIIIGGVQYSASSGDPQKAAAAKKRITNTIIALIGYFFLYGFLQFLIPGGIFH